jgi:hypothetical protein
VRDVSLEAGIGRRRRKTIILPDLLLHSESGTVLTRDPGEVGSVLGESTSDGTVDIGCGWGSRRCASRRAESRENKGLNLCAAADAHLTGIIKNTSRMAVE